jgi:hypothetical protein
MSAHEAEFWREGIGVADIFVSGAALPHAKVA